MFKSAPTDRKRIFVEEEDKDEDCIDIAVLLLGFLSTLAVFYLIKRLLTWLL